MKVQRTTKEEPVPVEVGEVSGLVDPHQDVNWALPICREILEHLFACAVRWFVKHHKTADWRETKVPNAEAALT